MKNKVPSVLLGLLLSVIVGCGNAARAGQPMSKTDVTIYYIPFNYETYVPVTTDSIQKDAICVLSILSSSNKADSIRHALEAASTGEFDNQFVRVKVVGLLAGDLFIDKCGAIRGKDMGDRDLDADDLQGLKNVLDGLAKSQGCDI